MRTIGTVVRGVRAPIIREGDNIADCFLICNFFNYCCI